MLGFVLGRILQAIPLMAVVVLLVFGLLQLIPGDPVQAMVGQYPVPPEFRASIVAAEMTEFIPGAGPPPHKIPSRTPPTTFPSRLRQSRLSSRGSMATGRRR